MDIPFSSIDLKASTQSLELLDKDSPWSECTILGYSFSEGRQLIVHFSHLTVHLIENFMNLLKEMFKGFVLSSYLNHEFVFLSHVLMSSLEQFVMIWWKVQLAHSRISFWPLWSSFYSPTMNLEDRWTSPRPGAEQSFQADEGQRKSDSCSLWLFLFFHFGF